MLIIGISTVNEKWRIRRRSSTLVDFCQRSVECSPSRCRTIFRSWVMSNCRPARRVQQLQYLFCDVVALVLGSEPSWLLIGSSFGSVTSRNGKTHPKMTTKSGNEFIPKLPFRDSSLFFPFFQFSLLSVFLF